MGDATTAAHDAASPLLELASPVAALQAECVVRAGRPRAGSATAKLIALLPALPVLSAPTARAAIGISQQQTLVGLKALADTGVLTHINTGLHNRQYAAVERFDLVTAYGDRVVGRGYPGATA